MSQSLHNHDFRWKYLRQKERKFFQHFNCKKYSWFPKYTLKCTILIENAFKYLLNTLLKLKKYFGSSLSWTFTQKERDNTTTKNLWQNTVCLKQKNYASQKKLHSCWLWWLRHFEGLSFPKSKSSHGPFWFHSTLENKGFIAGTNFLAFSLLK